MPHSATERPLDLPEDAVDTSTEPSRALAILLTVGGLIGLLAAVVLLVEKIALLKDPDYVPSCSINPVLSCGSVMITQQAEAFGFPNPIMGIVGFAMVTTVGVGLLAGARYKGWFWLGLQVGVTFGVVFIHWLIYQSLYVIHALCPYCMVVWAVTIPIFLYVTVHNLRVRRLARVLTDYPGLILNAWFVTIVALIAIRFWDYWSTLF